MNPMNFTLKMVAGLILLLSLSACGIGRGMIRTMPATSGKAYQTETHQALVALPPPKKKIVIAVYKFRDQTGQYKPVAAGSTFSTAVTQGATTMLMKALEDAGKGRWFTTLERESLPNLLNERKIIRSTRRQYKDQGGNKKFKALPSLLYAPVILEGGIIAYETNLVTGGFGARYLGVGANAQYRRDAVTIFLRLISVKNGEVLKTVTTSKTILSRELDLGLFKFVSFKKLLEVETGFSVNEPTQMAVLEAIEKAVHSLIIEGAANEIWNFESPLAGRKLIEQYYVESPVPVKVTEDKGFGIRILDKKKKTNNQQG